MKITRISKKCLAQLSQSVRTLKVSESENEVESENHPKSFILEKKPSGFQGFSMMVTKNNNSPRRINIFCSGFFYLSDLLLIRLFPGVFS